MALTTNDITLAHENWHPAVHQRFGEKLFYFLVRFEQSFAAPTTTRLRRLMAAADIRYACEYPLFGGWDALIRVWLTDSMRHRFMQTSKDPALGVRELRQFETEELYYLWRSADDVNLLEDTRELDFLIARHEDLISRYAKDDADEPPEGLTSHGLLFTRPGASSGSVKFYLALTRLPGDTPLVQERTQILRLLQDELLWYSPALYVGNGNFADYLIRLTAPAYDDVRRATAVFDRQLQGASLRAVVFLIANADARESDNINQLRTVTPEDEQVARLIGSATDRLSELDIGQRQSLGRIVRAAAGAERAGAMQDLWRHVLLACLSNDARALTQSLAPLLEFEFFLREYLKRLWGKSIGPNWPHEVRILLEQGGFARSQIDPIRLEEWTLGNLVKAASITSEADKRVRALLHSELGPKWLEQARTILNLRNDIAHGKLRGYVRLDDFAGEWGVVLERVLTALPLHVALEDMVASAPAVNEEMSLR